MPPADLFGLVGRQSLQQLRQAHHVGEQDRHVLGSQETASHQEVTRVGDDRRSSPRGARWPLGLRHTPDLEAKGAREPARKCEPPGGLYIHLARREMCRSCAPSVTRHPEYEPSCNRGHAESGATVQR